MEVHGPDGEGCAHELLYTSHAIPVRGSLASSRHSTALLLSPTFRKNSAALVNSFNLRASFPHSWLQNEQHQLAGLSGLPISKFLSACNCDAVVKARVRHGQLEG